ncbi:MAG: tRNA 2-thiouridine(34) synthase MnmA [Clostridia bacterium]|nr:tRNA 2-thiouridine(34) synthase MnmA [Clostridia bacterium]
MKETVVLGFSGGVDSSVSAMLLKRAGYRVHGVYLDTADAATRTETETAAEAMEIPLTVVPVRDALEEAVKKPFTEAYLSGRTPNPCILCNPAVKFRLLLETADAIGAEKIATGHYARAENGCILKGHPENDQSYMLCRLKREQAARLILPLGPYPKREVRVMAEEMGLSSAHKKDSMEICFIADNDHIGWLAARAVLPGPGPMYLNGKVVGEHNGICRYTVGQRIPGMFNERKAYVARIDAEQNALELALWEDLFHTSVTATDFSWLCDAPAQPFSATVRVRHTKWENPPCTVYPGENGTVRVECESPVRAPAPGQSMVLYDGERLLGGGFIV